jgi:predicted nucleic acid-binding protein
MLRLFVDTSAWFAFANRDDPDHKPVAALLGKPRGRLITSNFIFDETVTLCLYRLGHSVAEKVGRVLLDSARVDLLRITPEDENAAWELFCKRPDQTYSFTDCTSFVIMRRLGITTAAALDDDFAIEGFESRPEGN